VRENGRESSLCGESMTIPGKVGNATSREKFPHNFVGISPQFLSEISLREPLFEGVIPARF
jgi:hypothetical protein